MAAPHDASMRATTLPTMTTSLADATRRIDAKPWRVVEAQHRASTMRLVDTLAEQRALEDLLESSKPPLPDDAKHLHYLLATPFRYPAPPPAGSRFRGIGDPGVWYGATYLATALAEVAYWRIKFLLDSPATPDLPAVAHTALRAQVAGNAWVLTAAPFSSRRAAWEDPFDYSATQSLAREARAANVALIRYRSVRDPQHRACFAVLTPKAFRVSAPLEQHAWRIQVSRSRVLAESAEGAQRYAFEARELGIAAR